MKSNNFIDTTSDDYYLNPYKCIYLNNNQKNLFLTNIESDKNINLIIKTLTSIIMFNNDNLLENNIFNTNDIESKTKIDQTDQTDKFIIFKFVANNQINELNIFLNKNNTNINIQDNDGDTALHIAIFLSNYNACNILMNSCADIFIKDKWGQIPLHRICFTLKDKNTLKIVDLMIKYQNNKKNKNIFNYLDKYNNTPLHLVIKYILKNDIIINKYILSIINKLIELTNINLINNDGLSIKDLINMLNLTK